MLRTKYGQRQLKHAKRGINSCVLAAAAVSCLVVMILISYSSKGEVGIFAGFLSVGIMALSVKGLQLAGKGFKEREKNYITCKVGAALNAFLLFVMLLIFIRGLL